MTWSLNSTMPLRGDLLSLETTSTSVPIVSPGRTGAWKVALSLDRCATIVVRKKDSVIAVEKLIVSELGTMRPPKRVFFA